MHDPLHALPGSESDLRLFARFWEWERNVKAELPRVLADRDIETVFQPIFRITEKTPTPCGYEALTRFPIAPDVPAGLWFRTAREVGLGHDLELLAAETAIDHRRLLPTDCFLNINASLNTAADLASRISPKIGVPLVIDIPYNPVLSSPDLHPVCEALRAEGARISLDDTPLDQLHNLKPTIRRIQPNYLKIDVLVGLYDNPMGRFNLAEAATWCQDEGIALLAERVESPQDLKLLNHLGVELAQGYSLARPV